MFATDDYLERIWDGILSEDENRILETFRGLSEMDKETVLNHLQKMTTEKGWLPVQIQSAGKALKVLKQK